MADASTLMLIAGLYLLALASPGPNFFIISQLAIDGQPGAARRVALGVATGSTLWACAAAAGLAALLGSQALLATGLRITGAVYLLWYGIRLLRSAMVRAPTAPVEAPAPAVGAGWRTGLFTSLTNPKSAAFWTSVFASTLPPGAPGGFVVAACGLVALLSASWHLGLALLFARRELQAGYLRVRRPLEGLCGGALVALGLQRILRP